MAGPAALGGVIGADGVLGVADGVLGALGGIAVESDGVPQLLAAARGTVVRDHASEAGLDELDLLPDLELGGVDDDGINVRGRVVGALGDRDGALGRRGRGNTWCLGNGRRGWGLGRGRGRLGDALLGEGVPALALSRSCWRTCVLVMPWERRYASKPR